MIVKTIDLYEYFNREKPQDFRGYLSVYSPSRYESYGVNRKRPSVLIIPGGGYSYTSEREAEPVAMKFLAQGYNAFVLYYTCEPAPFPIALQEAGMAMVYIRENAKELAVREDKIVSIGFSAGGHLAGSLGTMWHKDEIYKATGKTMTEQKIHSREEESPFDVLYIGINYRDRNVLYDRINLRVDLMLKNGLLDEAKDFYDTSSDTTACQAIGYKELAPYFKGESTLEECVEKLKLETRHYAKRQLTWFRKNGHINWVYPDDYDNIEDMYSSVYVIINDFLEEVHR